MTFLKDLNTENFRALFRAVYCYSVSVWVGAYLWNVTFAEPGEVSKYAEFIIGFVLGTLIATLINFYFGGSENAEKQVRNGSGRATDGTPSPDADILRENGDEDVSGDGA